MGTKKSWSQAGQDLWALENASGNFTFLDVGCMEPYSGNNTYALELAGWKGLALDFENLFISTWNKHRSCPAICANALNVDWGRELAAHSLPLEIGYLSLDLYGEELQVLRNLIAAGISFRCATIEHDSMGVKLEHRNAIREFMLGQGYTLAIADVLSPPCVLNGVPVEGKPFEDWWTK
jgi:hypothetical protein